MHQKIVSKKFNIHVKIIGLQEYPVGPVEMGSRIDIGTEIINLLIQAVNVMQIRIAIDLIMIFR